MSAASERPAGRPACGARPAGAPHRRALRGGPLAEYLRLVAAGVSPEAASVLAPGPFADLERAYWRLSRRGARPTPEQCAAHAAAQNYRRQSRRSAA